MARVGGARQCALLSRQKVDAGPWDVRQAQVGQRRGPNPSARPCFLVKWPRSTLLVAAPLARHGSPTWEWPTAVLPRGDEQRLRVPQRDLSAFTSSVSRGRQVVMHEVHSNRWPKKSLSHPSQKAHHASRVAIEPQTRHLRRLRPAAERQAALRETRAHGGSGGSTAAAEHETVTHTTSVTPPGSPQGEACPPSPPRPTFYTRPSPSTRRRGRRPLVLLMT